MFLELNIINIEHLYFHDIPVKSVNINCEDEEIELVLKLYNEEIGNYEIGYLLFKDVFELIFEHSEWLLNCDSIAIDRLILEESIDDLYLCTIGFNISLSMTNIVKSGHGGSYFEIKLKFKNFYFKGKYNLL